MHNKTIILTLFIFQLTFLSIAQATLIKPAPAREQNIESILDNYIGLTNYTRIDDSNDTIWGMTQGTLNSIRVIGKQAAFNNMFGITKTDGTGFIPLITANVIEDSISDNDSVDILSMLYSDYLLAIFTPKDNIFTSNPDQNRDHLDHMVSWFDNNNPDRYFVGFEDLYRGGDQDYNDFVLELIYTSKVPEPYSIALLGLGLIIFGLSARRRKLNNHS